jgi:hypothetical protein
MKLSFGSVTKTWEAQNRGNLTDRMPNNLTRNLAWATAFPLATHIARPFLTIDAASLRLVEVIEINAG